MLPGVCVKSVRKLESGAAPKVQSQRQRVLQQTQGSVEEAGVESSPSGACVSSKNSIVEALQLS